MPAPPNAVFPLEDLEVAVICFTKAARQSAKHRPESILLHINSILGFAQIHGLPSHIISRLLIVILRPNQLELSSVKSLLDGLYPSGKVSSKDIYLIASSLGHGRKPSIATQNLLLRWISMVWEYLDDTSLFDRLYGALFNLIDSFGIRASLCHFLATITRRQHVKPFRVRKLLNIVRIVGSEPAFVELAQVFRQHQPYVVLDNLTTSPSRSKHLDQEWGSHLRVISSLEQDRFTKHETEAPTSSSMQKSANRMLKLLELDISRPRKLTSAREPDGISKVSYNIMPLDRFVDFINGLVLHYRMRLQEDNTNRKPLNHWLALFINSHWKSEQSTGKLTEEIIAVLKRLAQYVEITGHMPHAVNQFLRDYIYHWDGISNQAFLLDLMVHLPIQSFQDSQPRMSATFERSLYRSGTLSAGVVLLTYYDRLILCWSTTMLGISTEGRPTPAADFSNMASLIDYSSLLALSLLSTGSSPSQALVHAILVHLGIISKLSSRSQPPPPSPLFTYFLMFILPQSHSLSAICAILTAHRRNLEHNSTDVTLPVSLHDRDQINALNGILMDTANLLWRSRAFNALDSNAHACLLPKHAFSALQDYAASVPVPSQNVAAIFGLSSHPMLSGIAIAAFREMEDAAIARGKNIRVRHAGPVTQRSLGALERDGGVKDVGWREYRICVLDWLSERGLFGIQELMGSTMKGMGLGSDRAGRRGNR